MNVVERTIRPTVMSGMFLSKQEIHELTNRIHYSAQTRVLRSMGIEHRARPDGSLAVLRTHVENTLSGVRFSIPQKRKKTEPNWG